jgi:hypothetical protein
MFHVFFLKFKKDISPEETGADVIGAGRATARQQDYGSSEKR